MARIKYLDPRADLTFKRIFGEHDDLAKSFLNALLPFEEGEEIETIEFLPAELVPDTPLKKDTIVDVRCKDNLGRQFIVEMQMFWTETFMQRVLFNASKAYVRQLDKGEHYNYLQPVYSLNLVNDIFFPDLKDFYHLYNIVNIEHTDKVIEGLHFVFVELPKFKPQSVLDKKMMVLWLRFLTEMGDVTNDVPEEFTQNPEINKAVGLLRESSYSDAQILGYEKFWDIVRVEYAVKYDSIKEGKKLGFQQGLQQGLQQGIEKGMQQGIEKGMQQGIEKGMQQGIEKGRKAQALEIARNMKSLHISVADIAKATGLTADEIELA